MTLDQDTRDRVDATIINVLALGDLDVLDPASSFADDFGADSLDLVELVMALEEEFDISVPEEELEGIRCVGDLYDYVKARLAD